MSDRDIMALLCRADAADKRMQFLQNEIDQRTHWLDAAKERIQVLEERLDKMQEQDTRRLESIVDIRAGLGRLAADVAAMKGTPTP